MSMGPYLEKNHNLVLIKGLTLFEGVEVVMQICITLYIFSPSIFSSTLSRRNYAHPENFLTFNL